MTARDHAYIGPLGGLVRIPHYQGGLSSDAERATTERVTTSGVRRIQVARRASRQWDFSFDMADPSDFANLAALAAGEFGIGPFWFVDPWAQVTNLLSPRSSLLDSEFMPGTSQGGPVTLADGSRAGRSMVVADPANIVTVHREGASILKVPVIPGRSVCGSVYASGAGTVEVRLTWWSASGDEMSSSTWSSFTPGGSMERLWRMSTPVPNAAAVSIGVRGANRITRPAVTWTSFLTDWHVGQGAPSVAIPASLSQDIILATRESRAGGRLASVSTTIREVG